MCEQLGSPYTSAQDGNHFLFNNDTNKEFVKRFADWHEKGYVTTQEIYGAYTSGLFVEQGVNEDGTAKQRSYMSIGSSAGATHQRPDKVNGEYPFEVGITSIPQANDDNKKVISQGPSLCMFYDKDPEVVEATWLFMKFLTTNVSFQAEFGEASGYVPVLKSVADDPLYADFLASADGGEFIAALSAKVCLEQADYYYTSPAFNGSSDARDAVGELLQAAMVNWKTTPAADRDAMIDRLFSNAVADCKGAIGE
ncbi:MAG: extracellular solute-binding protein [Clostridia bacterium]|nr:extracellular solute-binding protein [Clostridia bacterium]